MKKENIPHKIYTNSNGQIIPSTTTVLKLLANESINKWANFIGTKNINLDELLGEYAEIGTLVHQYIENYLLGIFKLHYKTDTHINRCGLMGFKNFLLWHSEYKKHFKCIKTEFELVTEDYGGTIDCYCKFNDKYRVMDFKTSSQIHNTQFLQLGGYINLLEENGHQVDEACILSLSRDKCNKYIVKIKSREEMQPYVDSFLKLKSFYHEWDSIK